MRETLTKTLCSTEESKEDKRLRKKRERASKSAMMDVIRETFTDAPVEMTSTGFVTAPSGTTTKKKRGNKEEVDEAERREYEERAFVRLPTSAKDRKKKEREMMRSGLDDIEDYGDIASFMQGEAGDAALSASASSAKSSKFLAELQKVRSCRARVDRRATSNAVP